MKKLKNSLKKDVLPSTIIITKVIEVTQYAIIAIGFLIILLAMFSSDLLSSVIGSSGIIELGNFEIKIFPLVTPVTNTFYLVLQGLYLIALASVLAIIFRNINVILKSLTTNVESEGLRVFTNDTKQRLNAIGVLVICQALITFIFELVSQFRNLSSSGVFVEIPLTSLFMGLIVLCIAQVVEHGIKLQEDVDGLI